MKSLTLALLLGVATALPACTGAPHASVVVSQRMLHDPATEDVLVVSHRACWQSASENSLDGIRACIARGIDVIEIDVRETADGHLVLMHDSTLERTTNGQGKLSDITLAELRKLRLKPVIGGRDVTALTDRRVPTLEEALAAAKGRILVNLDAKEPLHERIFAEVEKAGMERQVILKIRAAPDDPALADSVFAHNAVFMPVIFACSPTTADAGYCVQDLDGIAARYARYNPVGYELIYTEPGFLDRSAVSDIRARGQLWVNTLKPEMAGGVSDATALTDPDGVWGTLIDQGVSMIQTDHPEALLAYLRRRGLHR